MTSVVKQRKKDVLTRLDSLLQRAEKGDQDSSSSRTEVDQQDAKKSGSGGGGGIPGGILKKPGKQGGKKKHGKKSIRFPDNEEMHEIIGYGGAEERQGGNSEEEESSSEDEDIGPRGRRRSSCSPGTDEDELTIEEKNFINLTKKNTNFNAHAQNLLSDENKLRLGAEKKSAPLITVRPFVREHSPGKVNKVSPMINGQLVQRQKNELLAKENEMKEVVKNDLGPKKLSSVKAEAPAPPVVTKIGPAVKGPVTAAATNATAAAAPSAKPDDKKATVAAARLSFLNSTIKFENRGGGISKDEKESEKEEERKVVEENQVKKKEGNGDDGRRKLTSKEKEQQQEEGEEKGKGGKVEEDDKVKTKVAEVEEKKEEKKKEEEVEVQKITTTTSKKELLTKTDSSETQAANFVKPVKKEAPPIPKSDPNDTKPPTHVKLTRKSPYVTGSGAGQSCSSILKGTPKPVVVVKKPPLPKDKPKIPEKPRNLLISPSPAAAAASAAAASTAASTAAGSPGLTSSQSFHAAKQRASPVAAPRKASFRTPNEYANVKSSIENRRPNNPATPTAPPTAAARVTAPSPVFETNNSLSEVTISDDSRIEVSSSAFAAGPSDSSLTSTASSCSSSLGGGSSNKNPAGDLLVPIAECYSTEADTQNEVIFEVNATAVKKEEGEEAEADDDDDKSERKEDGDGDCGDEDRSANEDNIAKRDQTVKNKAALEEIRKSLSAKLIQHTTPPPAAATMEAKPPASAASKEDKDCEDTPSAFNRHDSVSRPSTKRQAPKPPSPETPVTTRATKIATTTSANVGPVSNPPSQQQQQQQQQNPPSAMRTSGSLKNGQKANRVVQFSPDTKQASTKSIEPISYNRWMMSKQSTIIESSFTGMPIAVSPVVGVVAGPHPPSPSSMVVAAASNKKSSSLITGYMNNMLAASTHADVEVRRWTEKKKRSKSVPRGSEIDELMGSSKTKPRPRFFPGGVGSSSPPPVRRQSRVELYEADRKRDQQARNKGNRFSFSKIFKQFSASTNSLPSEVPKRYDMDEEHQREILERERSKIRPAIIHPIDFHSGSVEVVKIRPNPGRVFEKHKKASLVGKGIASSNSNNKHIGAHKSRVEYMDSKDSGHETSSIHTDNSDGSTTSESPHSRTPSSLEDPTSTPPAGNYVVNGSSSSSSSPSSSLPAVGQNSQVGRSSYLQRITFGWLTKKKCPSLSASSLC